MSMDVQRQIRENTLELNEFLKDLKGWEQTVKEKEKKILRQHPSKDNKNLTSPRRHDSGGSPSNEKEAEVKKGTKKANRNTAEPKNELQTAGKPGVTGASHTYENFRNKWDTFDVDAALKEIDEDDEDQPVTKVPKRELPGPRVSQSKIGSSKGSDGSREMASTSHSLPPGKIYGGVHPDSAIDRLSNSLGFDDSPPDAASEKDLGNDYFKEGKYVRAIDCYSRSIALQPTAVAYANRAMAALKIRRFEDAELDCSEAISLDDRYTKAYARRGTARRELKKYLLAAEDIEFALLLEPENKELKKQYAEVKELYEKEKRATPVQKTPAIVEEKIEQSTPLQQPAAESLQPSLASGKPPQRSASVKPQPLPASEKPQPPPASGNAPLPFASGKPEEPASVKPQPLPASGKAQPLGLGKPWPPPTSGKQQPQIGSGNTQQIPGSGKPQVGLEDEAQRPSLYSEIPNGIDTKSSSKELSSRADSLVARSKPRDLSTDGNSLPSTTDAVPGMSVVAQAAEKQVSIKDRKVAGAAAAAATQVAAARAAAAAMASMSRNIVAPRSAYEFELTWKGFGGNRNSQARLLKIMDPLTLPKVFKDSLSAPLLVEIIRSLELLFPDDAKLAVQILENLTKVGRFKMTVMFLTSKERSEFGELWERVFMSSPVELHTQLQTLRVAYRFV